MATRTSRWQRLDCGVWVTAYGWRQVNGGKRAAASRWQRDVGGYWMATRTSQWWRVDCHVWLAASGSQRMAGAG